MRVTRLELGFGFGFSLGLGLLKDMDAWGALGSPRTAWREYVPRRGGVTNLCYRRVTLDCNAQCQYRYICEGTTLGSMAG